ncbi:MAG: 2Fe-2S iron-sulfur cluster-binding protein [Mycetocola sp.]
MPRISFEHDGSVYRVDAPAGQSIMRAAVGNSVPGIDGECGGDLTCATCHVYVRDPWLAQLEEPDEEEREMLEVVEGLRSRSRLGCQVLLHDNLDGIAVDVPSGL